MAVLTAEPLGLVISQSQTALVFASISERHFVLQRRPEIPVEHGGKITVPKRESSSYCK